MKWDSPQFILTLLILAAFVATVGVVLFASLEPSKTEIVKAIMTQMGAACLLAIGYWFSPSKS